MSATIRAFARAAAPDPAPLSAVALVLPAGPLARALSHHLPASWRIAEAGGAEAGDAWSGCAEGTLVYSPPRQRLPDLEPDLTASHDMLTAARRAAVRHLVLVSSTAVYGATPHHAGLVTEAESTVRTDQPIARGWRALEAQAIAAFGPDVTILRAAPVLLADSPDFFSTLFTRGAAITIAGYDPTLQFLSVADLARAIACAVAGAGGGVFNIVPAAPVPLRAALRIASRRALPVPWSLHRARRLVAVARRRAASARQVQYIRYHLTASGDAAARDLGYRAQHTSADAVRMVRRMGWNTGPDVEPSERFDPFGMDRGYIDACWRGALGMLHRHYWRVEARGLEHIPGQGGAVLVGMHRGFMPFDGVMTLLSVVQATRRVPRFLIHPGVGLRFPFLFNLMSKLGGIIASHVNATRVLESGELLAVYPEGIRGAFTLYTRAHRIGPSWRNDCIAFALRHQAPLVPFVTVGSADIFPIVGRIDWRWWKRLTEWPFLPVTTPLPLPSKWHTVFLEPLQIGGHYGPESAEDPVLVRALGREVKRRMEAATAELLARRPSVFYGSVFEERP